MTDRTSKPERDAELRAIEQQAAEWFGRCELGLTPEQEREFLRWLERDARHGEAMREMDETWEVLDRLKEIRRPAAPPPISAPSRPPIRRRMPVLLAAAAAIVFAALGFWRPWQPSPITRQVATEAGGMKNIDLPDGSVVQLNAESRLEFHFTRTTRAVHLLRGEAHFVVAKDAARPFIVTAGGVAVKAVGTAFNVRCESKSVEVFVTEGTVRVEDIAKGESLLSPPPEPTAAGLLSAGQRAVVTLSLDAAAAPQPAVIATIAPAEIEHALAWRARLLEFDLTPLAEVVAEFNRYNSHQLAIDDPELARQPFGGSFRADNYHVFVRLLEQRFGVVAERGNDVTTLRRAR